MAVAKAISGNVQRTRGGITIFTPGTVTSGHSQVTELVSVESTSFIGGSKGGLPIVSATHGNAKAISAGTFAYFLKGHWVMLANSITTQLSGVANTALKSGAAQFFRLRFPRKTTYKTHFTSKIEWDANKISGPTYTITKSNQTVSFSDDASVFSASEPGEFTYMSGSKNPTNAGYQARKLW